MTAISEVFTQLKQRKEAALIAYVTVGDPHMRDTPRLVAALIEGGADLIELGIPFSDPIADGPTIQGAVARSLSHGAKPLDTLDIARAVKDQYGTPLILMTYFNPIFRIGVAEFMARAKESEISGIIVPDLPVEESADYKRECDVSGLDTIFLASPSTSPQRLKRILSQTSGYLYLISHYGVTGARANISDSALELVKKYSLTVAGSVPLAVGFGISTPDHVHRIVQSGADGVIVGSAFVNVIEANSGNVTRASRKLESLAREMKKATTNLAQ